MTQAEVRVTAHDFKVTIVCLAPMRLAQAQALAAHLGLPLSDQAAQADYHLLVDADRLSLQQVGSPHKPLSVEWVGGRMGYRTQRDLSLRQPLARAIGITAHKRPSVLDATAGFGRDAWLLAALGCQVQMLERSPLVVALLADGLRRAFASPVRPIAERLRLDCANATTWLRERSHAAPLIEVVYLDPMYPHTTKTALPAKEMQLLRGLLGEDRDSSALLEAALAHARQRVVVKRPSHGASIDGRAPDFAIHSPNTRYDIYRVQAKGDGHG